MSISSDSANPTLDASQAPSSPRTTLERESPSTKFVSSYTELSQQIRSAGLLERRYRFYWIRIIATVAAFAAAWAAVIVVGDSWWQLVIAAAFAVLGAQFAFLSHDGAHRQIFDSARWNEWTARILGGLGAGLSYGWWMGKHSKHHRSPNQIGYDPDIGAGPIVFEPDRAQGRTGAAAWFTRRQGWLFFPLLTLEGLALHAASLSTAAATPTMKNRWTDFSLIVVRVGAGIIVPLLVMSPVKAAAFIVLNTALFGVFLGGSFAPNHKGMPLVPAGMTVDFLRRQVLMSRNISGGPVTNFMMGGLNYQIEHHLFPNMPQPNLARAQPIVRAYCAEHSVSYTETSLLTSYGIVMRYLNAVGLSERDPFECPLVRLYR